MRKPAALAACLVVCAACASEPARRPAASSPRPRSTATITIEEPPPGAKMPPGPVRVRLRLDGGTISDVTSKDLTPTDGHVHLKLDGELVSMTYGLEQTVDVTEPGTHVVEAEFVALDHGPFSPRVLAQSTFTVG